MSYSQKSSNFNVFDQMKRLEKDSAWDVPPRPKRQKRPNFQLKLHGQLSAFKPSFKDIHQVFRCICGFGKSPPCMAVDHRQEIGDLVVICLPFVDREVFFEELIDGDILKQTKLFFPHKNGTRKTCNMLGCKIPYSPPADHQVLNYALFTTAQETDPNTDDRDLPLNLLDLLLDEEGLRANEFPFRGKEVPGEDDHFPSIEEDLPREPTRQLAPTGLDEDMADESAQVEEWRAALKLFAKNEAMPLADDPSISLLRAVDCEMVLTENGRYELARIAVGNALELPNGSKMCGVVDAAGRTLYDEFCLPEGKVKDYLTQWSGITVNSLRNVTKTLKDVQADLAHVLPRDAILVGHSLENDLKAMRLSSARVIDTSVVFPHTGGHPLKNGLSWLMKEGFQVKMKRGASGHDPVDDARCAMKLVLRRAARGHNWLTPEKRVLSRALDLPLVLADSHNGTFAQPLETGGHWPATKLRCKDDDELVPKLVSELAKPYPAPLPSDDTGQPDPDAQDAEQDAEQEEESDDDEDDGPRRRCVLVCLRRLQRWLSVNPGQKPPRDLLDQTARDIERIAKAVPNGLLCIDTGTGDLPAMLAAADEREKEKLKQKMLIAGGAFCIVPHSFTKDA